MKLFFLFLFLILMIIPGLSQDTERTVTVSDIVQAYQNLNYKRAIELSDNALTVFQKYQREELLEIYLYRAYSQFTLGNETTAAQSFRSALSLNSKLVLDAVKVSPKITSFFSDVKKEYLMGIREAMQMSSSESRYVVISEPFRFAAWRSLILPGWGQFYKNDEMKAYMYGGAFALNTIAFIYIFILEEQAHDSYLSAKEARLISDRYKKYNRLYRARQFLTYSDLLIYSLAFADALWAPIPEQSRFSVAIQPSKLTFTLNF